MKQNYQTPTIELENELLDAIMASNVLLLEDGEDGIFFNDFF